MERIERALKRPRDMIRNDDSGENDDDERHSARQEEMRSISEENTNDGRIVKMTQVGLL